MVERARRLRREMSVAERIFWKMARSDRLGFGFRRQHQIEPGLTVDFYCHEARLAIEFDGEQHDPEVDAARDARLLARGIDTMRIPNRGFFMLDSPAEEAVKKDWIEAVIRLCEQRAGRKVLRS
jgi:very-short-patch-repair endonuclease